MGGERGLGVLARFGPDSGGAAREHAPVTPEEFAKRIGESRFASLIREHLDVFARFSTVMRTRGLSIRTEKSYLGWCCRFLARFGGSGPEHLGPPEVAAFLEELAVERNVSASTQNQALNALVFSVRQGAGAAAG